MIRRAFNELSAREVLALAMDVERNNAERLLRLAETYDRDVPQLHQFFLHLHKEELGHMGLLEALWRKKFGSASPPDVSEFDVPDVVEAVEVEHGEHMLFDDLDPQTALGMVYEAERRAASFYSDAIASTDDKDLQKLFAELRDFEEDHIERLSNLKSGGEGSTNG